jgi:hypothetical protein
MLEKFHLGSVGIDRRCQQSGRHETRNHRSRIGLNVKERNRSRLVLMCWYG